MTLKLSGFRAVVKVHLTAQFHHAEYSGLWVINSALDFGQQLQSWSWISLELLKQSTSRKRRYELRFFHVRWRKFGELWSTYEKNDGDLRPMTLKLNMVRSWGCQCTCASKISSSYVQRFMSYRAYREKKLGRTHYSVSLPPGR